MRCLLRGDKRYHRCAAAVGAHRLETQGATSVQLKSASDSPVGMQDRKDRGDIALGGKWYAFNVSVSRRVFELGGDGKGTACIPYRLHVEANGDGRFPGRSRCNECDQGQEDGRKAATQSTDRHGSRSVRKGKAICNPVGCTHKAIRMLQRLVPLLAFGLALAACSSTPEPATAAQEPGVIGRMWGSTVNATQKLNPFDHGLKPREMKQTGSVNYKALAVELRVEPPAPKLGEQRQVAVIIRLTNKSKRLVQLNFPTTQRIDVLVKNKAGKTIEHWSDDQRFENEAGLVAINPGERLEYTAHVSTREMGAGEVYTVEGFFPAHEPLRAAGTIAPVR